MVDIAIENAVRHIRKKGEEVIQKKFSDTPTRKSGAREQTLRMRTEELLRNQLEEGKMSALLLRHHNTDISDIYFERRTAVSERNATERLLVKEVLKNVRKEDRLLKCIYPYLPSIIHSKANRDQKPPEATAKLHFWI